MIPGMDPDASIDIQPGNFMFARKNPLGAINEADVDEHTRLR